MNYKRILTGFFAAAAALCSVGCADDGEVADFETELNLSYISYTAPKAGGEQTISIECNDKWAITETEDVEWYSLSATEGSNNSDITIKVDPNATVDSREATFSVASGEVSIDFVLGQAAGDEVLVPTPVKLESLLKGGDSKTITIESNSVWSAKAVFAADEEAWFELSGDVEDIEGDGSFTVAVDPNDMATIREASIKLTGSKGASVLIPVSQSDADPTLVIVGSLTENKMASTDTSFTLTVESNTEWTIEALDFGDATAWFSLDSYTATGDKTVTATVEENKTASERSYTIKTSYTGLETPVEYTFTQGAADASISITPDSGTLSFTSAGGTSSEYTVTSNDTWKVVIPAEAEDWLSYELTTNGFTLTADNDAESVTDDTDPFKADVKIVCDNDEDKYVTIGVTQSTYAAENLFSVSVAKKEGDEVVEDNGTLSFSFAADQTTEETYVITIDSNVDAYDVAVTPTVDRDDLSWLTGEPTTNTEATETTYTMTATSNTALTARGATIVFTAEDPNGGSDIVYTVNLTQSAANIDQPTTDNTEKTVALANTESATSTSTFVTNDPTAPNITITYTDGSGWLKAEYASTSVTFTTLSANTTLSARVATVKVACGGDATKYLEFTVTQAAGDAYFAFDGTAETSKSIAFDAAGTTEDVTTIKLSTNDTYNVVATNNESSWLSWTAEAGQITFSVDANAGVTPLSSTVTLTSVVGENNLTINVSQEAEAITIDSNAVAFDLFGYSSAAEVSVDVDNATEWTIESISIDKGTAGWLTITDETSTTLTAGSAITGPEKLTFAASINGAGTISYANQEWTLNDSTTAVEERSATVTLKQGSTTKTISVTQDYETFPTFTPVTNTAIPNSAGYSADGGVFEVEFTGTSYYTLLTWGSWYTLTATHTTITHSPTAITCLGSGTLTITMDPNPHTVMRGGWGQYKYDKNTVDEKGALVARSDYAGAYGYGQMYPYQAAGAAKFVVTEPTTTTFDDVSAASGTFNVESNISWTATSNQTWLTFDSNETASYQTDGIYLKSDYAFEIAENGDGQSRTATVTLTPNLLNYAGTDRTDIVAPDPVTFEITQNATVADASATAFVSSTDTNTVTLTVSSSQFGSSQTFVATEFALSYTNTYAGSPYTSASGSASGNIAISSIALDQTDATKMIITTSENVYNTDKLTLTYSGTGLVLESGAAFPGLISFDPSYVEYLNSNFETAGDDQYFVAENCATRDGLLTHLDGETSLSDSYYANPYKDDINGSDRCFYNEGTDNTSAACYVFCSDGFDMEQIGDRTLTLSLKFCLVDTNYLGGDNDFGIALNPYAHSSTQTTYTGSTWTYTGWGWSTFNSSAAGTWKTKSCTITEQDEPVSISLENMSLTMRYNGLKSAFLFDDIYLGDAVSRPKDE